MKGLGCEGRVGGMGFLSLGGFDSCLDGWLAFVFCLGG